MEQNIKFLNRFTTLPFLLDFLVTKKLVLLNPSSWDDKNDSQIIEAYKKKANIKNVFALCFTHERETIHHWQAFAKGSDGCCIEFSAEKLFEIFDKTKELRHGIVQYKKINDVKPSTYVLSEIPFIKRKPYEFEREYRVIWEGETTDEYFKIEVPLEAINKITISGEMPESVFKSFKFIIRENLKMLNIKIYRSTVYKNKTWIKKFQEE